MIYKTMIHNVNAITKYADLDLIKNVLKSNGYYFAKIDTARF